MINTGWEMERMNKILVRYSCHFTTLDDQRWRVVKFIAIRQSSDPLSIFRFRSLLDQHLPPYPSVQSKQPNAAKSTVGAREDLMAQLTQVDMYVCNSMPFENLPQLEVEASAIRHFSDLLRSSVTVHALTHASHQLFVPSKQPNLLM